jgi:galactokinase
VIDWPELVDRIGLRDDEAASKVRLFRDASAALSRMAGATPSIAHWVPGRIEFLGKHTDYAGGRSLLCAVERGIAIVAHPRDDASLRIAAAATGEVFQCALGATVAAPNTPGWATYPATVTRRLTRNFGGPLRGADVSFTSDLPIAAGMSSSSALVVASFLTLAAVNHLSDRDEYRRSIHTTEDLAEYVGSVESGFDFRGLPGDAGVGTLSGCEDQTAMLCARPGQLVQYAFCPVRFERVVPLPNATVLVVASSGVRAEKTAGAMEKYNRLSRKARAIAEVWRRATGRADVTIADIIASGPSAARELRVLLESDAVSDFSSDDLLDRFDQFTTESDAIIPAVSDALARGDLEQLGDLVDRSVDGAVRLLHNQVPETVSLTELARDLGAVAASPFGAGFGGSIWALVPEGTHASRFVVEWKNEYVRMFPDHRVTSDFFVTHAGPSACRLV